MADPSDALVLFGATGDLAYRKIFPAIQALIRRQNLAVPVVAIGKATWGIIWAQFIGLGIICAILQSLGLLISPPNYNSIAGATAGLSASTLLVFSIVFFAIVEILLTPVSFLAAGGILFLIARIFGGKGTYREQIYTTLLYGVPMVILSYLLFLVPVAGAWLLYLPHIYSLVLLIISMMAVHQFGRGKAK